MKIKSIISSPFVKIPVMLVGVVILEKALLKGYTYLEETNFNLF